MDVLSLASLILCVILAFLSVILWRKAMASHHLLLEAANRFEQSRHVNLQLKQDNMQQKDELAQTLQSIRQLERTNEGLKTRNEQLSRDLEALAKRPQAELRSQANRIEDLQEQVTALTNQLKTAEIDLNVNRGQNHEWRQKFEHLLNEKAAEKCAETESLRNRIAELERENKKLAQSQKVRHKIEEVLSEHKALKRKIAHQQRMITTIRGRKELVEERLGNYETALRLLSGYTLGHNPAQVRSQAIGPLVGSALESIGLEILPEAHESGALEDNREGEAH